MEKYILILLLTISIIVNINQCSSNHKESNNSLQLITALEDTLVIQKNKNNQYLSSIAVLSTTTAKQFTEIESKNREIKTLQHKVKQYQERIKSLTIFQSNLSVDTIIQTVVEQTPNEPPTYHWKFKDKWIDLSGSSNKDSTQFSLQTIEKYDVAIYEEKRELKINILNQNPYSKTNSIQSFYKKLPPTKRWGIGIYTGYGYNIPQGFGYQIGIGINYQLIKF